jgi:hypothetical protein
MLKEMLRGSWLELGCGFFNVFSLLLLCIPNPMNEHTIVWLMSINEDNQVCDKGYFYLDIGINISGVEKDHSTCGYNI